MSGYIPAQSVSLHGELHLIRLQVAGDPLPEVNAAPEGRTRAEQRKLHAEQRKLHAERRLRYVRWGRGVPCIVIAVSSAPGAF